MSHQHDLVDIAYQKAKTLFEAGIQFSEFGTRRRRSYKIQDLVVGTLIRADNDHKGKGKLVGTSNVCRRIKKGHIQLTSVCYRYTLPTNIISRR